MPLTRWLEVGLWLTSAGLVGLSLWVVLPAPTFAFLPLSVGVPELSPLLWLLSGGVLLVAVSAVFFGVSAGPLLLSLIAVVLFSWPLVQIPATIYRTHQSLLSLQDWQRSTPISTYQRRRPIDLAQCLTGIPRPALGDPQDDVVAQPDGIPLRLRVYRPRDEGVYPGVVVIYGGAWQRGSPDQDAKFHQVIASWGYTVLALDYRHAPAYRFPTQLEDVRLGMHYIREHGAELGVNPQRLAVLGRSAGSQLAMLLGYDLSLDVRAVINFYGPVDLAAAYAHPPVPDPIDTRAVLTAFLGGSPAQVAQRYQEASPIHHVRPGLPPTLLFYGQRDHVVQPHYGQQLAQALRQQGNIAVWIPIPWADHAFDAVVHGLSSQLALYATERFLAATLQRES
ncbi:MAG: hypothetical protein OHK0012_17850 [Synechococcales cyanobacterium]